MIGNADPQIMNKASKMIDCHKFPAFIEKFYYNPFAY